MSVYVVEKDAILYNLDRLIKQADDTPIWAVLKANGYGLGVEPMAQLCLEKGIRRFAVTSLQEAQVIRQLCAKGQILMLRPSVDPEELQQMLDLDVIATIGSSEQAAVLNSVAAGRGTVAEVHVKIDTGMGRYGFLPGETEKILNIYRFHDHLAVSGIYTHFHSAFGKEKITMQQAEQFRMVLQEIEAEQIEPGAPHCCNSHGFLRFPELKMQGVRLGSALLGRVLVKSDLRQVGVCETAVEEVRWLPAGHTTGYGGAWKAKKPTKIAVIPVGWYHGFTAEHGNDIFRFRDCLRQMLGAMKRMIFKKKLYISIEGKKCRVLGHVGMLHTVCDVTGISCNVGDAATVQINPTQVRGMEIQFR